LLTYHDQILLSRGYTKTDTDESLKDRYNEMLNDPEMNRAFRKHLDSELSSEVYWFFDAVDVFKRTYDSSDVSSMAEKIRDTYVVRRSVNLCVCLSLSVPMRVCLCVCEFFCDLVSYFFF
jgi:hypothetical protein